LFAAIFLEVQTLLWKQETLFFKFIGISWMILCSFSQSAYFAASYSGSLDRMLTGIKVSEECAKYYRKTATVYALLAWILLLMHYAFLLYSVFFAGGYLDVMLAPITIYVDVPDILLPRIAIYFINIYLCAAWTFPHTTTLMLATVFSHQYKQLDKTLEQQLSGSDERQLSDSEIETLRERHQEVSLSVKEADKFLKFSNAAAFCLQLFGTVMLLYSLIFYHSTMADIIVVIKRATWLISQTFGLAITAAGGIMVNHYVSVNAYFFIVRCRCIFQLQRSLFIYTSIIVVV